MVKAEFKSGIFHSQPFGLLPNVLQCGEDIFHRKPLSATFHRHWNKVQWVKFEQSALSNIWTRTGCQSQLCIVVLAHRWTSVPSSRPQCARLPSRPHQSSPGSLFKHLGSSVSVSMIMTRHKRVWSNCIALLCLSDIKTKWQQQSVWICSLKPFFTFNLDPLSFLTWICSLSFNFEYYCRCGFVFFSVVTFWTQGTSPLTVIVNHEREIF